jgi:hypothetical protein
VTGLTAGAQYEYQVCGNAKPGEPFVCVGPDDTPNTSTKFTAATWRLRTPPTPSGTIEGQLLGVSCASPTACTAVGYYKTGSDLFTASIPFTLAERWDGTTWTIQTTPSPSGSGSVLNGVSCTSATACTAVGSSNGLPFVERWDGRSWTIQATPNLAPPGFSYDSLWGVSCTAADACTAVGNTYYPGTSVPVTLAERWDGITWTTETTPTPADGGSLNRVSCTSATACTAVGFSAACAYACVPGLPLAERWDGRTWTIQTTADDQLYSSLWGVSCTSATACTAVGNDGGGTLAERWDGASWTIQTTPSGDGNLSGVSCTSAKACTGVAGWSCTSTGTCTAGSNAETLAERWDGASWTIQTTPSIGGGNLSGISCSTNGECSAVGSYVNSAGVEVPLAERYSW